MSKNKRKKSLKQYYEYISKSEEVKDISRRSGFNDTDLVM